MYPLRESFSLRTPHLILAAERLDVSNSNPREQCAPVLVPVRFIDVVDFSQKSLE